MHSPQTIASIRVSENAPITAECDICKMNGTKAVATIDGPTTFGPWAHMCDPCAAQFLTAPSIATRIVRS